MEIALIGPSHKFTSGISYFTISLANALSARFQVQAILLRKLLPQFLFPGAKRVGKKISDFKFNQKVMVYNGIDWYWIPSILGAIKKLKKADYIILQWWTSSVAHTYLLLKILNKIYFRKKLIIEFHEVLDPLEKRIWPLKLYVQLMAKLIFKNNYKYVTHSQNDALLLMKKYHLKKKKFMVVDHGSYDNFHQKKEVKKDRNKCNILFFGLLRPYKGVEYLVEAFQQLDPTKFNLTIAGEIWENYDISKQITPNITFIPKYLSDQEVIEQFNKADVLVLPYTRASQSGAAHIAVSYGLPIIVTTVGGLKESMGKYQGATFIPPRDSTAIVRALKQIYPGRHQRYSNPHPWSKTVKQYQEVLK